MGCRDKTIMMTQISSPDKALVAGLGFVGQTLALSMRIPDLLSVRPELVEG
jgi:hypothetical protein